MDGWFKAVDARSGKVLWQFKTGSGIIGQPITYRGPDGHQYVAVLSGVGGWAGAIVVGKLDPRDSTAGGGLANAVHDLPQQDATGRHAVCLRTAGALIACIAVALVAAPARAARRRLRARAARVRKQGGRRRHRRTGGAGG